METENFDLVVIGAGWAGLIAATTFLKLAPATKLLILDDGYDPIREAMKQIAK